MTEFVVGENGVLSWSSPVPPNGVILYYNVIISTADSGQLVTRVEQLNPSTIDVSNYGKINMDYNVTVMTFEYGFSLMWAFFICTKIVLLHSSYTRHYILKAVGMLFLVSVITTLVSCTFMTIFLPEAKMLHLGVLVKYLTVIYHN